MIGTQSDFQGRASGHPGKPGQRATFVDFDAKDGSVLCIEVDKGAHAIIDKNISSLGIEDQITTIRAYANAWSTRHQDQLFDLVLADPPYDIIPWRDMKILQRHVNDTGFLILSWPGKADWPAFPGLEMVQNRNYGDSQLVFYQRPKK